MVVLVVDVGLFVGHLALPQQVPQVPVLQEPLEELKEGLLASPQGLFLSGLKSQESGEVAGPSCELYFFGVVCPAFVDRTPMFFKQGCNLGGVGVACELSYCSFGYVSADVLLVILGIGGFCFEGFASLCYGRESFPLGYGNSLWISSVCFGVILGQFFD